ncbi:MAG: 1-deoxy-D-xylulose-5-phosphate reductoisomerase [Bifidobacteriaceae bacterium]|jgi:1-deoxy-D-xylulose-5-phosphate reductoisomerase|nr:1-deoxy-D-xylulose-5-phosphate reductoisomerase [Bifidobacteriaceae bacterium]
MAKRIVLLGSTGSIGQQTLEIVQQNSPQFEIVALGAYGNNKVLFEQQIKQFKPKKAATVLDNGQIAVSNLAAVKCDIVLNAINGSVGIFASAKALQSGNILALANKESLVAGGQYLLSLTKFSEQIIPLDSEHSAIWQCLKSGRVDEVSRFILTASGGPFRTYTYEQLKTVTVKQALQHPTWNMGPVVTINSATMVNKALEIIEAHYLFGVDISKIDVVLQPSSQIHSMVEFYDGSTIMQLSPPNMKLPIALAINYPNRLNRAVQPESFAENLKLDFQPVNSQIFPIIEFTKTFMKQDERLAIVFNAANEELVKAFLNNKISYLDIINLLQKIVSGYKISCDIVNITSIIQIENKVRELTNQFIDERIK